MANVATKAQSLSARIEVAEKGVLDEGLAWARALRDGKNDPAITRRLFEALVSYERLMREAGPR